VVVTGFAAILVMHGAVGATALLGKAACVDTSGPSAVLVMLLLYPIAGRLLARPPETVIVESESAEARIHAWPPAEVLEAGQGQQLSSDLAPSLGVRNSAWVSSTGISGYSSMLGSVRGLLEGFVAISAAESAKAGVSALIHTGTDIGLDSPLKFHAATANV
jgi:hypothetical protein